MALIQVGVTATRNPDGSFNPSVPIYAEVPDVEIRRDGFTHREAEAMDDFASRMAQLFHEYHKSVNPKED